MIMSLKAAPVRRIFSNGMTPAIVLAVIVFFGGLIGLGANADLLAKHREEAQALNAFRDRVLEVADQATANTEWDDAVLNVSDHFNLPWVIQNIGFYYTQPSRYEVVYVIDKTDRPVFGMSKGGIIAPNQFDGLAHAAAPLIASVRAQEARRGPLAQKSKDGSVLSTPISASDVARYKSELFILTATLIQPEFGVGTRQDPRAAIVFTGKPIDAAFLNSLAQRLLLRNIRLTPPGETPGADAYINLTDRHGARLARIVWTPHRPGGDLISVALLPILIGVGAPLMLYFLGRRTSRRLAATLQALAQARDEADAANAQKSIFLANMSHEIRTPLNGILAMAQVMELHELSDEQRQRLEVISHSGETLLTIVNDVLDLSKIEAGRLDLDPRPFDISAMVQALKGLYDPVAEDKAIGLTMEIDPLVNGVWRGDPDRIRQVLANLISNAIKFTEQGQISVRLTPAKGGPGGVRITVSDTGIGIAADKIALIFDKFRQAESSTSRRYGGTGLGLAICRELVLMMDGQIWLESQEGQGSTFVVQIPLERIADAPARKAPAKVEIDTVGDSVIRVLGVDDNATNRLVLAAILRPFGFILDLREDGLAAVEAWRATPYDLILMDVQMPVLDGVAAAALIRAEEAQTGRARTPIIALTANAMTHQMSQYRAAGMDDCIAKPIRIVDLQAAISRLLGPDEAVDAA